MNKINIEHAVVMACLPFLWLEASATSIVDRENLLDASRRYEAARAYQGIGKVAVPVDASYIVFEWLRPYDWDRQVRGRSAQPAKRPMAWLYHVRLKDRDEPIAEYALMAKGGSSYYLGSLSPDGRHLSFYCVNYDDSVVTGVTRLADLHQTLFEIPPDDSRLDQPPVWLTNDAFIYPAKPEKGGTQKLILANLVTGKIQEYKGNTPIVPAAGMPPQSQNLSADIKLIAISANGSVEVYQQSNADILKLYIKRNGGGPEIIFENKRHD